MLTHIRVTGSERVNSSLLRKSVFPIFDICTHSSTWHLRTKKELKKRKLDVAETLDDDDGDDNCDYMTTGSTLGELSLLTGMAFKTTAICETTVQVWFIALISTVFLCTRLNLASWSSWFDGTLLCHILSHCSPTADIFSLGVHFPLWLSSSKSSYNFCLVVFSTFMIALLAARSQCIHSSLFCFPDLHTRLSDRPYHQFFFSFSSTCIYSICIFSCTCSPTLFRTLALHQ